MKYGYCVKNTHDEITAQIFYACGSFIFQFVWLSFPCSFSMIVHFVHYYN